VEYMEITRNRDRKCSIIPVLADTDDISHILSITLCVNIVACPIS
jgi:hypothetical protein